MEARSYVAPQVYWSRYLPAQVVHGTCILSAPPAPGWLYVQVFATWFLQSRERHDEKSERSKMHRRAPTDPRTKEHAFRSRRWFQSEDRLNFLAGLTFWRGGVARILLQSNSKWSEYFGNTKVFCSNYY